MRLRHSTALATRSRPAKSNQQRVAKAQAPLPEPLAPAQIPKHHLPEGMITRLRGAEGGSAIRRALTQPPSDVRPASAFMSYEAFEQLVRETIARVPDLAP